MTINLSIKPHLEAFHCMLLILIVIMFIVTAKIGYESGQVDALVGKQSLELVTNTLEKVTWHKIPLTNNL